MPQVKEYFHDVDLKANELFNSRLHNISTADRITLGGGLSTADKGYQVYDVELLTPFFWDGVNWNPAGGGISSIAWGGITGTVTDQTDLTTYLAANYYPLSSNPAGYLSAVPTLQEVVDVDNHTNTDIIFYAAAALRMNSGVITFSPDIITEGALSSELLTDFRNWSLPDASGTIALTSDLSSYLTQTAADLLYYPLSTNPANYLTSFTEVDPVFNTWLTTTPPLYSFTETDPVWTADKPSYLTSAAAALVYEPIISAGTTSQYWRGDKTWQTFPTIPAAQIQSDWTQSNNTALDYIKNKPSIPAAQIQSDWNQTNNTLLDYIKNKPTIPTVGTWGALNYPTWTSGTPFVKMDAAGSFTLDTTSYQPLLTNPVTGTGTQNYVSKWDATGINLVDSQILDDGTYVRVGDGGGSMGFPYETLILEKNGDVKFGVYTSVNTFGAGGSAIVLGATGVLDDNNFFPGFEFQFSPAYISTNNFIRYNFIERDATGSVVGSNQDIFDIYADGRVSFQTLAGGGTLMVVTDNNGFLSTQAIPGGGGGITSLNGLSGATQTFTDDTNVTIVSSGTTHTLTWAGTLADARIASASTWNGKQAALSGSGVVKSTAGTISYISGTSSQFIKGDGSLDSSTYLTSAVTSVGATSPITSSGGNTPTISTSMATNKLIGRSTAGIGVMEEISVGTGLSLSAGTLSNSAPFTTPLTTKGDIYVRNASADTRLPIGLDTQVLLADSSTATGLKWGSNTTPTPTGYYGAWQDNVTQTAAVSNTGYAMIFRTVDLSNGVTVVTNGTNLTRITFANTGIYNLQFSSQFQNTDNAQHDVTVWLRLNGSDVAGSSGLISVPARKSAGAGNEGHLITGWNYVLSVVAGQYYELMWSTTSAANVTMQYYAAGSPPPSAASVIMTVTQQSGIMAGTGITAINSLTGAAQTLTTGTTGTDFAISSSGTTHTFNIPDAGASSRGLMTSTQWLTFTSKQAAITGAATTITSSDLTVSRALVSNASGKVAVSTVTDTELGYVSGVTSSIQTQIGNKFTTPTGWTDYIGSSTIVGSTGTTGNINYILMGKIMFLQVYLTGTSTATNWTFTIPNTSAATLQAAVGSAINNNTTPGLCVAFVTSGTNVVSLSFAATGNPSGTISQGWTASNTKVAKFTMTLNIA